MGGTVDRLASTHLATARGQRPPPREGHAAARYATPWVAFILGAPDSNSKVAPQLRCTAREHARIPYCGVSSGPVTLHSWANFVLQ